MINGRIPDKKEKKTQFIDASLRGRMAAEAEKITAELREENAALEKKLKEKDAVIEKMAREKNLIKRKR